MKYIQQVMCMCTQMCEKIEHKCNYCYFFWKKETNAGKLVFLVDAATMEVVDVDSPLVEGGEYKVHVEPEVMISL